MYSLGPKPPMTKKELLVTILIFIFSLSVLINGICFFNQIDADAFIDSHPILFLLFVFLCIPAFAMPYAWFGSAINKVRWDSEYNK